MKVPKSNQYAAAIAICVIALAYSGWGLVSDAPKVIDLGIFVIFSVALMLLPVIDLAEQILHKLKEQATVVTNETTKAVASVSWPNPRTHRQELELALVSRLRDSLAIVPDAGDNAKKMLDRLLAQDGPPMPSADEQVAERALRQVLSVVQSYLPPDGISIDDAMSQIIALVDLFPVRSSAGEAAQPVAAVLSDDLLSSSGYGKASCGGCKKVETIELAVVDPGALVESKRAPGDAPRVTKEDIEAEITHEHYFTAEQGTRHPDAHNPRDHGDVTASLGRLTFCVLKLKNGFTVTGESACVSPENFNAQIGRDIARANAIEKMWLLLGFRLAVNLAAQK